MFCTATKNLTKSQRVYIVLKTANNCFVSSEKSQQWKSLKATYNTNNVNGSKIPYRTIPHRFWSVFRNDFDPFRKFGVLDIYGASREVPYGEATDDLGHHYEGSIIESMVQQMLSVFCPAVPQNHTKMFKEVFAPIGKRSCKRIMSLTNEDTKRIPHCSCLNEQAAMIPEALKFCKKFYNTKAIVAYFTDV